ncbi:MAG: hypothetical protein ACYCOU_07395 [Sulfobacillus sp.]
MSVQCRLIETPDHSSSVHVGDMFYVDMTQDVWPWAQDILLSDYYRQHNAHRKPLMVRLPNRDFFLVDSKCVSQECGWYGGWTVTGDAPLITVAPSINLVGRYHGWLKNGVLSDDVEGRKYP